MSSEGSDRRSQLAKKHQAEPSSPTQRDFHGIDPPTGLAIDEMIYREKAQKLMIAISTHDLAEPFPWR